jgi:DNA repair exonuclease SbcCD ATPase subunit
MVSSAIAQYNALSSAGIQEQNAFAIAVSATNTNLGIYLAKLNGTKASLAGYGLSLATTTAQTVIATAATMAFNAALTMGISAIITGLITALTKQINKEKELKENANEAKDAISSLKDELKSNTKTVNDIKERYAELAQEVENLGKVNQNRGTLSNEDYEEFLDLSNQLANIFPQLTKGYDSNGNAILNLSGNVNTIVGSLNDLIDAEKRLANQEIMGNFPKVFSGWTKDRSDAKYEEKKAQEKFDRINQAYTALNNGQT